VFGHASTVEQIRNIRKSGSFGPGP
jgi:hypothetical protein